MSEVILSDESFNAEVLQSPLPVLVDFWAPWCGPCKIVGPIVEELSNEYAGKLKVGKLNVDDHPQTASQYGIMSIPTLMVFKNGAVANQIIGAQPKTKLQEVLNKYVGA
jgi:thioredoxin 1